MLISFRIFDQSTSSVNLLGIDGNVTVVKEKGHFTILENGVFSQRIEDKIVFPQEYLEYLQIHKPDENLKEEKRPPTLTEKDMEHLREISQQGEEQKAKS